MFATGLYFADLGLMVRHLAMSGDASKKLAVSSPSREAAPQLLQLAGLSDTTTCIS